VSRSDDVAEICNKIVRQLGQPFELELELVTVSASVGIAFYPADGQDATELIHVADEAMYKAKQAGHGSWQFGSGEIHRQARRRLEIENSLHHAIGRGELVLHYQPQVCAVTSRWVGAEALVRWQRDSGLMMPGSFMEIAEDSDLVCQIGEWVLRAACQEARRLADSGHPIVMSVNVSARQFQKGDLQSLVAQTLAETGLDPRLLKLELTESSFMKDLNRVAATMTEIKRSGVTFAVDDFGVGFSSLQYLSRLPLDSLKIDKSFIDRLEGGDGNLDIVTAVIAMARSFQLVSVAEGVETHSQWEILQHLGCDQVQGYLTGRPMDAAQFRRLVV